MYRNSWLPKVFNDSLNTTNIPKANPTVPATNVLESEKDHIVEPIAPGLSREDLDVNINGDGDLIIKTKKKAEESGQRAHYLRRELAYSKYEQTLILPGNVQKENTAAHVANGVLTTTLSRIKAEEQKAARQITMG